MLREIFSISARFLFLFNSISFLTSQVFSFLDITESPPREQFQMVGLSLPALPPAGVPSIREDLDITHIPEAPRSTAQPPVCSNTSNAIEEVSMEME